MEEDHSETNNAKEDTTDDFKLKDEQISYCENGNSISNSVSNCETESQLPDTDQLCASDDLKKEESENYDIKNIIIKSEESFTNSTNEKKPTKKPKSRSKFSVACGVCGRVFKKTAKLTSHMLTHTGEKNFMCEHCPKQFSLKGNLTTHVRVIHDKIPQNKPRSICEMCNKDFSCKQWMEEHKRTVHTKEFDSYCDICGLGLTTRRIKQHKMTCDRSAELKRKQCTTCGLFFSTLNELDLHKIQVHKEKCYFTCHCGKEFQRVDFRHSLREHRLECQATQADNKFGCSICGKGFDIKYYFDAHMRVHKGEKPFHCESCGKSFSRKESWALHTKNHLGVKEFKCSICPKAFARKDGLKIHERTHSKEKPYFCDICEKRFSDKANLITHKKKYHCELRSDKND